MVRRSRGLSRDYRVAQTFGGIVETCEGQLRTRLPNRRRSETVEFAAGVPGYTAQIYCATLGFYNDNRLGEIFVHPTKSGSDRDIALQEAAIAISFALQHGATLETMRLAMPRTSSGAPEGPIGTLLDILVQTMEKAA